MKLLIESEFISETEVAKRTEKAIRSVEWNCEKRVDIRERVV